MDDDLSLLDQFRKGDTNAFNGLIEKYYTKVLNLVYRFYGCERHEAEDIAQEVFLRVYRGLERFEGRSSFFTYLYRVTMNLCLKKRPNRWREAPSEMNESAAMETPMFQKKVESVEGDLLQKEQARVVREVVLSLPEEQREVVLLSRFHDMPYEEIARTLHLSLAAVKSRLHRARLTLKERLAAYVQE